MTCKINADTTDGLQLISDTSGEVDIQDNGTTRVTIGDNVDIHGNELILDADGDTSITADTDDRIDIKVGGTDSISITPSLITITDADALQPRLLLKNTNDGTSSAFLDFQKDSASPANDNLGIIRWIGDDDGGNTAAYVTIIGSSPDVTDGSEDGSFSIQTLVNGTNATRFTITDGNIGVGTTAPTNVASAYTTIEAKGTDTNGSGVILATSTAGIQTQLISSDATSRGFVGTRTNHNCGFGVNNGDKMILDTAGRLLLGPISGNYVNGSSAKSQIAYAKVSEFGLFVRPTDNDVGGGQPALFQNAAGSSIGSIGATGSNVSYNTSSDYRLKENVNYTWDATTRLKQLKPARFNWISDDTNTLIDGFLAHEVSDVVPEAITGTKDATTTRLKTVKNADGNFIASDVEEADWIAGKENGTYPSDSTWTASEEIPDYQGIDHSKLVPLLVKTIQELEARITALESE